MTFRTKLLLVSTLTVAGAVPLVTGAVSIYTRQAFERVDQERRKGLLDQFQRELAAQGRQLQDQVRRVGSSDAALRIAIEANRAAPDFSGFVDEARIQAEAQALDFLDILQEDGAIISSAATPAKFGYKTDWLLGAADWASRATFLTRIPLREGSAVAVVAIEPVRAGNHSIFIAGAKRLDPSFLAALGVAPGVRATLWLGTGELLDARGPLHDPGRLARLVDEVKRTNKEVASNVQWTADRVSEESVVALPLAHGGNLLGALLVGTSLREQVLLERSILWIGMGVGGVGILLGALIGWWTTARVTRPVGELVAGAHAIAGGDWNTRVPVSSNDEMGALARAFNQMTEQLIEQRDRTVQAERVAAWRELARRLAHELKNPLFPLQITVENLRKARELTAAEFDEVFRESTGTLLEELQNLKVIIGQFSEFAKMPKPEIESVDANAVVRDVLKLFDAQFKLDGGPKIDPVLELAAGDVRIAADPLQLSRALRNLVLNAMDAMPEGGRLVIRTERDNGMVRIQVSDSGQGLTEEECARLFTPYYTTKRHGTGLGLAIVQSVVSDHHGKIAVSGKPGSGATFTIELPARRDA